MSTLERAEEQPTGICRSASAAKIRALQRERGETPCFGSIARFDCDDTLCEYRSQCHRLRAEWRR